MWTEHDYRDRADDIRHVVTTLRTSRRFRGIADASRLALAGHSLGGYTVLGLGGAWPSWRLGGVRAILALTPYSLPFQRSGGLKNLAAPVMYQTGTLDPVFTLPLESDDGGYAQSPSPKYMVEIDGAAHLAWTDLGYSGRDAIVGYAIAFFDRYVKGEPSAPVATLAQKLPGVASYVHAD
jgi:predicted dienelactone hydrolase